jgi:hypothetical protein
MSILDSVAAKVRARTSKPATLGHPEILELSVVFRTPTDRTEIQRIKRRADAQKDAGDFDASLLAACCEEITEYGETVVDDEGAPVTFRDKSFQDKLGATSARDAVRTFYGSDGYVSSTAARLMEAAGWGAFDEVVIEEDPTLSS